MGSCAGRVALARVAAGVLVLAVAWALAPVESTRAAATPGRSIGAPGAVRGDGRATLLAEARGGGEPAPIVGMTTTPSGDGYWLVASDGGIIPFGDARSHGSAAGTALHAPIVGMAATPSGRGYWLVASDGGIFSFGDARFHGSTASLDLPDGVLALSVTRSANGYRTATTAGAVLAYGDARYLGSAVPPRRRGTLAAVYGDSLVTESARFVELTAALLGDETVVRHFPGIAICDLLPWIGRDAVELRPRVAVLEFSGNAFSACMRGPGGRPLTEPERIAKYRRDAEIAHALLVSQGTTVVFAAAPPWRGVAGLSPTDRVYVDLAARLARTVFSDTGAALAGSGRTWTATLPCLPFEQAAHRCSGGRIRIRARDNVHFCPSDAPRTPSDDFGRCPVWSSGAWRYGTALAEAAHAAMR